jgi:3-oxoacyl-[acyl-carrier protein] reductase/2-hydroxycyclohexanecarboxyl-CoA dehydrogenase
MNLQGKVAVVTGGGRGIGRAIVEHLAGDGATVVFGDINADNVRDLGTSLHDSGLAVEGMVGDVAKKGEMESVIDSVVASHGHLDILVNCAGINRDTMLHKMTDEQWDEVLAVDLTGAFYATRKALQVMRQQPTGGSIVGISSLSWRGSLGQANYASAKAGLVGLMLTTAREGGRFQVRANAICPGFIETDMTRALSQEMWDAVVARIPLGHAGEPADVAGLVAFLGSDTAKYITGQVIEVGGGLVW